MNTISRPADADADNDPGTLKTTLPASAAPSIDLPGASARTHTIPVIEERLQVGTRLTDTGRGVRIHKSVVETPHLVEQPLLHDELQVQRVAQDRMLDAGQVPQTRYEGDTLVIPVVEEVLVLQKQLRLTEEIRITRVRTPVMSTQTVVLKSERVELERFEEPGARSDGGRPPQ